MPLTPEEAHALALDISAKEQPKIKPLRRLAPNTRDVSVSVAVERMEALTKQLLRPVGEPALRKAIWGVMGLPRALRGDALVAAASQKRRKTRTKFMDDPTYGTDMDLLKEDEALYMAWKAVRNGDLTKASRCLDGITPRANITESTVLLAASKHPIDKRPPIGLDLTPEELAKAPDFSVQLVRSVVQSTPDGKAAGPSGWTWEILKAICAYPAGRTALTKLVNALVAGRTRPMDTILKCTLTLLAKPGGGVRPVAVEEPLVSLVSKCLARALATKLKPLFKGIQFAGGLSRGVEAAALATKAALAQRKNSVMRSLDISNAFNEGFRHPMMQAMRRDLPEAVPWMAYLYHQDATLQLGGVNALKSRSGQRQGDAMSMLAFCITLQPAIVQAAAGLDVSVIAYADDVRVIGSPQLTAIFERRFAAAVAELGLKCNASKTEVYDPHSDPGTMVFGAPVGTQDYVEDQVTDFLVAWERRLTRCVDLARLGFPHEADQILRRSLRPQLDSFIRVAELSTRALGEVNTALLASLRHILGHRVSWEQLALKYKAGGLSFKPVANTFRTAAMAATRELTKFGFRTLSGPIHEQFMRRITGNPEYRLPGVPPTEFETSAKKLKQRDSPFSALPQWMASCDEPMGKDAFKTAMALQLGFATLPKGTKARTFSSTKNLQRAWVAWSLPTPFPKSLQPRDVRASTQGVFQATRAFLSFALAKDMAALMDKWTLHCRSSREAAHRVVHEE